MSFKDLTTRSAQALKPANTAKTNETAAKTPAAAEAKPAKPTADKT